MRYQADDGRYEKVKDNLTWYIFNYIDLVILIDNVYPVFWINILCIHYCNFIINIHLSHEWELSDACLANFEHKPE